MNNEELDICWVKGFAAVAWNIHPHTLTDKYRGEQWVWARAFAAYYLHHQLRLTWKQISAALKRDHATCFSLGRKVEDALKYDKKIAEHYKNFETMLEP
jgi:chromosomal replication initiation ATPase DnaA